MARRRSFGGSHPGRTRGWRLLDLDPAGVVVVAGLALLFVVAAAYLALRSDGCDPAAGDCGESVVGTAPGPVVATTLPVGEDLAVEPDAGLIPPAPGPTGEPAPPVMPAPATSEPSAGGEVPSTARPGASTTAATADAATTLPGFTAQRAGPTTTPPARTAPSTAAPTTAAPTTRPPTTQTPTTQVPTTAAPTTQPPTTVPSTTAAPATVPREPSTTERTEPEPEDDGGNRPGVLERLGPEVDAEELSPGLQRQLERRRD